jgi:hypothetical protein
MTEMYLNGPFTIPASLILTPFLQEAHLNESARARKCGHNHVHPADAH